MILITHDLGVVARRTDTIAVMYAGRVVERATTRTLFRRPRHPYTHGLLQSIPRLAQPSHSRLRAITGRPPDLTDLSAGCAFAPRCPRATDRCREERPMLTEVDAGHELACFNPIEAEVGV
jgi:peptide/nickel transport system ATP-binding protein